MSSCYMFRLMLCNATYPIGCPAYRQEVGDEEKLYAQKKWRLRWDAWADGREMSNKSAPLSQRESRTEVIESNGTSNNFRDAHKSKEKKNTTKKINRNQQSIEEATRNNWPATLALSTTEWDKRLKKSDRTRTGQQTVGEIAHHPRRPLCVNRETSRLSTSMTIPCVCVRYIYIYPVYALCIVWKRPGCWL